MSEIKKVLICGIGAIGSIYADKISVYDNKNLKVLVDKDRYEKYKKEPKIFNGRTLKLNYILPENTDFKADLVIIATKFDGLEFAIKNIKNFVKDDTIIISLINGVVSEEIIAEKYGWKHTLLAYFIGHSSMRNNNLITFDGTGKIVFGVKNSELTDSADVKKLEDYFKNVGIDYEIPNDMMHSYWLKFMLNVSCNQLSAITGATFGKMQSDERCLSFIKNTMKEVIEVAQKVGVKNTELMIDEAMASLKKMIPEGKTSMLQDIESGRKTELDIFAGTMIKFGEKYNIQTPYNRIMKELIEIMQ